MGAREFLIERIVDFTGGLVVNELEATNMVQAVIEEAEAGFRAVMEHTNTVWLGDLAGFEVNGDQADAFGVRLEHRCGWELQLDDADHFLANLTQKALEHRKAGCLPAKK